MLLLIIENSIVTIQRKTLTPTVLEDVAVGRRLICLFGLKVGTKEPRGRYKTEVVHNTQRR